MTPLGWARRARELHDELGAIADVSGFAPTWWLVAATAAAAEPLPARAHYVIGDAEPSGDTFIGQRIAVPDDPLGDAIARAHAARAALRELDGQLPEQPLAVTIARHEGGARCVPSPLDVAAFAIGDHLHVVTLGDEIEHDTALLARLAERPAHRAPGVPFVCVSVGEDRLTVARHGHRRAWTTAGGPWLGLGRVGDLATTSTCHLVVDGYGHAWLAARIAHHHALFAARFARARALAAPTLQLGPDDLPHLALVPGAVPLGIAWRELPTPTPRALSLAYALGRVLHRLAGDPDARFSPTLQIPIAPGDASDPLRRKRRVVPSAVSVRFERGEPEPLAQFEARTRAILAREAAGRGLCARMLTAARAVPVPLAFKRRSFSSARAGVFDHIAEVLGGRACLSKLQLATPTPLSCAVSSPARLASKADALGSCVLTIIDDGERAAITACGSGLAGAMDDAADLIDAVLRLEATPRDRG